MRVLRYLVLAGFLASMGVALYELHRALQLADGAKRGEMTPELGGSAPPPAVTRDPKLFDVASRSARVTVGRGAGAVAAKRGGGVLVDSDGRRYELESQR